MKQKIYSDVNEDFINAETLLRRELSTQGGDCTWYCKSFNPYPMVLSINELEHQKRLQESLFRAITNITRNYLNDERLQRALGLPPAAIAMFQKLKDLPYKTGSYRADFLHNTAGDIKICEINARFPTNAYFITHYINNIFPTSHFICETLQRIIPLDNIPSVFIERFNPGSNICILKEREHDWDIVFMRRELEDRGFSCRRLSVKELAAEQNVEGLIIELHQDELLRDESAFIAQLCLQQPHFNDIRTVLLAHDKRLLAIFHDDEIMVDYLSDKDRAFLKANVIETKLLRETKTANLKKDDYVLKPNLLGKGEGILFGHSTSESSWRDALEDPAHRNYVLQRFVKQKKFQVCAKTGEKVSIQSLNVVGTLLCFDDQFFGPGIYRASKDDIVNVAGGGSILFPMLEIANA